MIRGLDTIRFMAFLAIFAGHTGDFGAGYLGVQAFFVLSGFLITPILLRMKQDLRRREFFIHFYGRRSLRIFPLYYAYLITAGILAAIVLDFTAIHGPDQVIAIRSQLPYALTYTYDFYHASTAFHPTPFLTHFWSLAVEEQFYLVWPLLIWLVPRQWITRMMVGVAVVGPVLRFTIFAATHVKAVHFLGHNASTDIYALPFSHLDAFATGGLFAVAPRFKRVPRLMPWTLLGACLTLGYGLQFLTTNRISIQSLGYPAFMSGKYYQFLWGYTLWNITFGTVLSAVRQRQFVRPVLELKPLEYLGKVSYGLYVFHNPIFWITQKLLLATPHVAQCAVAMFATIVISIASFELFEKRILGLKDQLFPRRAEEEGPAHSVPRTAVVFG